ncbi:hypothetical protein GOBAR_AA18144 [Gossypium barbadense]|uniref:SGF29 C-terminal domain-containing protein n=1 Tax=Gossypium barbadense TaxID=3634 RepID=A0A2P5XGQ7_GOSBA|nr:hypothetical protein GOBAR_AA18144 [Gossypium barbadense]
MSSPDIASILENSRELDRLRKEQEEVLVEINKLHKKLQANGNDQKRKRMKSDSDISRLSPSMRSHIEAFVSLKDEQVAARVTSDAEKDEWFVVKVINFDEKTKEFEVLDEEPGDEEEGSGQKISNLLLSQLDTFLPSGPPGQQRRKMKYKLPASCIIPFPKRNDPASTPEFPAGRQVLAVYPGTTALYKATVISTPRKVMIPCITHQCPKIDSGYLLEFDDDEEDGALPQRTVPFHKVVQLPEGHRQ